MNKTTVFLLIAMSLPGRPVWSRNAVVDLAGNNWSFQLDADDQGVRQQWFNRRLPDAIRQPGSLQEQGFGNDVSVSTQWTGSIVDRSWFTSPRFEKYRQPGNIKVPFWLQPDKHYVGPAWYQRQVRIPNHWTGKRIVLSLERCHWETRLWVDEKEIGRRDSLSTSHQYDLTSHLTPGSTHRLTIRVDNTVGIGVGVNAHSVTDHTQTNWNGMIGQLKLVATDPIWIDEVRIEPDVAGRRARVKIVIGNAVSASGRGQVHIHATCHNTTATQEVPTISKEFSVERGGATVELEYPLGEQVKLWDEFSPALYRLQVDLAVQTGDSIHSDARVVQFGMREITIDQRHLTLNGHRIFLRGTLDCCIYPLTGYPPTDVRSWKRVIRVCKAHGLNHIRFHSWCPPEAAFLAADELGFYFHVECAAWTRIGEGQPIDKWLYEEGARILKAYGNHPSLLMMAYGNEPSGPERGGRFLRRWVEHFKQLDPRRLYTGAAGWPILEENQYHVTPKPRIQGWGAGLKSRINAHAPETMTDYRDFVAQYDVPVVSHEIGQWCVYPNFGEIPKYTGVLKPKNFEIFQEDLQSKGMGLLAHRFLMASGKLQALCYKEEIESALRTPGMGGFQLLDLHDFPGQGTALVGVLDPFWDSKPYITPRLFRRFCSPTVLLARMTQRTWTADETFAARIEIAHFGPRDLTGASVQWTLRDVAGQTMAHGRLPAQPIPAGQLSPLGDVRVALSQIATPARMLNLEVAVEGTEVANDWDIWVYPADMATTVPDDVLVVERLDDAAVQRLSQGGKVLLMPPPDSIRGDELGRVPAGFSSIFWNTAWTRRQAPHTLGIFCDPMHPALADFPTEYHSNWQWWDLVTKAHPLILDDLPDQPEPIVRLIDDWFTNRRLDLIFQAKVGGGRLLACGIDLRRDLENRPVARQLLHSLLDYMHGDRFQPEKAIEVKQIQSLYGPPH